MEQPTFDFTVNLPEKVEGSGLKLGYWKYRVDTKTNHPHYKSNEYGCYRRYNDFLWLRKALIETYPGCVVPPMPEKDVRESIDKLLGGNAPVLHEFRRRALRKFLVRVGAHPQLAGSPLLQEFVELDDTQFERRTKEPMPEGPLKKMSGVKQLTHSVSSKLARDMDALRNKGHETEWSELKQRFSRLETAFSNLRDRAETLARGRTVMLHTSDEVAAALEKLAAVGAAGGSDSSGFDQLAHGLRASAKVEEQRATDEVQQVAETLTYYAALYRAAIGVVIRIQSLENLLEVTDADVASARKKCEKDATATAHVESAIKRKEEVEKHLAEVKQTFREEVKRLDFEKHYDLKALLKGFEGIVQDSSIQLAEVWMPILGNVATPLASGAA